MWYNFRITLTLLDSITHEMRLAHWVSIVKECNNSGMSKKAWCIANNINEKQFYYWQRRVREEVFHEFKKKSSSGGFVEIPVAIARVEDEHLPSSSEPAAVIKVKNCTIEINNSASGTLLESLIKVIANA